jgi:hypothetical protein
MLFPSTSKGAQRKGARDVRTYTHILLKHQLEKRDLQTLKEPRVGKFKRTKSISLALSCGFYGATSNLCTKVNHRSLLMRVEDIQHQGVICRTGPGAAWKGFFLPLLPQQPHLQFLKSQPPTSTSIYVEPKCCALLH